MSEQYINIDLPSKGLTYPGVDMTKIKIRPFLGKDEALIAELTMDNAKKKFITVLENVVQGIEPSKLTAGDAKYVMLWEAINSYTDTRTQKIVCEDCLQPVEVNCSLKQVNVVELPDDFKEPYTVELSKQKLNLRLLTLKDEMEAIDWAKNGKSTYLFSYASTIVDPSLNIIQKLDLIENLSTQDLKTIKDFHK